MADHASAPVLAAAKQAGRGTGRMAVRLGLAVGLSAAVCAVVWQFVPHRLSTTTDIVGFPIFARFDPNRYFDAFYLVAIAFPLVAVLLYAFLPVLRSADRQRPRLLIRPISLAPPAPPQEASNGEVDPSSVRTMRRGARVAVPALAVGACVGVVASGGGPSLSAWAFAAAAAYGLGVPVLAQAVRGRWSGRDGPGTLSAINGGAALVVVPLLYFVARSSSVLVTSDHHVRHYPWFPLWLMLSVLVVLTLWYRRRLHRAATTEEIGEAEVAVLTYVVGIVLLLVLIARLAPPLDSPFFAFDQAQALASAQLTFGHGLFPWRDIYVIHGIFGDILAGRLGMSVFEPSRWGSASGFTVLLIPMLWVSMYVFATYFARRNRLFAAGFVAVAVLWLTSGRLAGAGLIQSRDIMAFAPAYFRFAFLPLVLVLFDQTIRRRSRRWCAGFMGALVAQAIVVPETGLMAAGLLLTLVAFEWLGRRPGARWSESMMRTAWCVAFGAILVVAWVVFLAAVGALRGFLDYYVIFGPGHALSGAEPALWFGKQLGTTVEFVAPVVLLLLTVVRVTLLVRRRSAWSSRDWVMVAAASFVVLFYQKVLARADAVHVAEVFTVSLPLLLLWLMTGAETLDDAIRRVARASRRSGGGTVLRHPGTLAAVVALVALAPSPIGTLRSVAGDYHLATPKEPVLARLGYAGPGVIDSTMVHDLDAVLRTYAGAHGAVFDFNDELGLLYYLLNRVPGTRYYHVSMADTGFAQRQLISDVTRSRPRVVVFYGQGIGLPSWDGIEATVRHYDVSDYLLDHYVPLVDVDGQFVMIRSDLAASAPPLPPLTGHASTQDFFLANPECAWGYVPDFLAHPASLRSRAAVSVNSHVVSDSTVFFGGWTSNRRPGQSPLSVLAVRNGHVEATAVPNLYHSNTSPGSGFTVALPVIAGAGPVSFYEMNPDSTVSPLVPRATVSTMLVARADDRVVTTSDGRSHQVITQRGGVVDLAFVGQQRFLAVDLAPGTDLSAYHWLELSTPKGLAGGRYSVMDGRDQSPNLISFQTLPRVAAHVFVQVGSCPQWRGFAPTGLSLIQGGGLKTAPTVRLVR